VITGNPPSPLPRPITAPACARPALHARSLVFRSPGPDACSAEQAVPGDGRATVDLGMGPLPLRRAVIGDLRHSQRRLLLPWGSIFLGGGETREVQAVWALSHAYRDAHSLDRGGPR
jgi:hypothetical protein